MIRLGIRNMLIRYFGAISLLLWYVIPIQAQTAIRPLSKAEQQEIDTLKRLYLPQGVLKLEQVVGFALKDTNQMRRLKNLYLTKNSIERKAKASSDTKVASNLNLINSKKATTGGPFSPVESEVQQFSAEAQTRLNSGTSLGVRLDHNKNNITFPKQDPAVPFDFGLRDNYHESLLTASIRQDLLNNSFGEAVRQQNLSANLSASALEQEIFAGIESWALNIIELYHQAWFLQKQYQAAQEQQAKQDRLLRIVKLKFSRGTAERSDVLQIEASKINVENQVNLAEKALSDVWEGLVINLGLPRSLLLLKPSTIPLNISPDFQKANQLCSEKNIKNQELETSTTRKLKKQLAAANAKVSASKSEVHPNLYLLARAESNSIEDTASKAISESLSWQNSQYLLGIGFDMLIGNQIEKAELVEALKAKNDVEINLAQEKDLVYLNRTTACRKFKQLQTQLQREKSALEKQQKRSQLDEQRFQIGKIDASQVVLVENDVISSQLKVNQTTMDLSLTGWVIKKHFTELEKEIKTFQESAK